MKYMINRERGGEIETGRCKIRLGRLMPGMILMLLIAGGCGNRAGKEEEKPDTLRVEVSEPEVAEEAESGTTLMTSSGIGPIRKGMRIVEIQPQIENLYDSISRQSGYESNYYSFYLKGEPRFTVYEFEKGMVSDISADSDNIVVPGDGNQTLSLGDSFSDVLKLKGVKPVWQTGDEEGMWCWERDGIWFVPDQETLPEDIAGKFYNQRVAPTLKDINSEIKIGYIGTGMPW